MLSFFKNVPDRQSPRIPSNLENIRRTLYHNQKTITAYWRTMNWSVRSDHVLVGLLYQLSSAMTAPIDIYSSIRNQLDGFTMSRGIASTVGYGRVQPKSYFYGHECQEVLVEQPFDEAVENIFTTPYSEWETVKVIEHPFSAMDYQLANGKIRHSGESGLCVIKFDLALMYTQYVLWRRDRLNSVYEDGTPKTIMNFVHTYPIVNMLKSHNERVWFNRLFNLISGKPNIDIREDTRHRLMDPYLYLDMVQSKLINDMERSRANFHEWCCWIPGIYTKNLKQHLQQDNILETQQIKLPWLLGWVSTIEALLRLETIADTNSNKQYLAEILKKHREYTNSRTYGTIRGLDFDEVYNMIESRIISLVTAVS